MLGGGLYKVDSTSFSSSELYLGILKSLMMLNYIFMIVAMYRLENRLDTKQLVQWLVVVLL